MTSTERERMGSLVQQIQQEQNPQKLSALVQELSDLIDGSHPRVPPQPDIKGTQMGLTSESPPADADTG